MQQAATPPKFTEAELLDLLAAIDGQTDGAGVKVGVLANTGGVEPLLDVEMEENNSVWDPSVNVVLDGEMFTSEKDFESFMSSLEPSDGNSVPTPTPVGTKRALLPTATQRPKRYRKSRKQEIDHLRAVAAELEKKLKELYPTHNQNNSATDPFWKRVSNILLEQRQKSVVENARLRDLVREQMTAFKTLQRSLKKTPVLSQKDVSPEVEERTVAPRQAEELYRDLFRNMSALYCTGVDTLLPQTAGSSTTPDGSKKVNIEVEMGNHDDLRMSLQVVEKKLVSFSFEKIREKAWEILTGANGHEGFELAIQNRGDEIFGWCKLDNSMGPMQMLGNVAVRQYVEANKLTIIWECQGDIHQGDSKTRIQPKGWCVFEPAEGDPANATIFQRCAILSPITPDGANSEMSIGAMTELVLENYQRSVVYIFDGMLASIKNS